MDDCVRVGRPPLALEQLLLVRRQSQLGDQERDHANVRHVVIGLAVGGRSGWSAVRTSPRSSGSPCGSCARRRRTLACRTTSTGRRVGDVQGRCTAAGHDDGVREVVDLEGRRHVRDRRPLRPRTRSRAWCSSSSRRVGPLGRARDLPGPDPRVRGAGRSTSWRRSARPVRQSVRVSTMLRQPVLQPRKQGGHARPVEAVGVRVEAPMDHVVRADLERDERDLPGMRVQERDRRVQLRPGRVVAQRVVPGAHRAGRLARATDVPEGEPRDLLLHGSKQVVDVPVRRPALAGLVADRQRGAEREVGDVPPPPACAAGTPPCSIETMSIAPTPADENLRITRRLS